MVALIRVLFPSSANGLWTYLAAGTCSLLWAASLIMYEGGMRAALRLLRGWRALLPILALVALATVSIAVFKQDLAPSHPLSSPGVVFVLGMAVVTILGFLVTIAKLDEFHSRIYDYSHLIEKCEELVDNELARVESKGKGRIMVFANAPAFGNMSAPEQYPRFRTKLVKLLQDERVEVVLACLSWKPRGDNSPHDTFYRRHWPTAPDLTLRIRESESLINHVVAASVPTALPKVMYRLQEEIKEVPFHLFMTTNAAVLFVSLGYPLGGAQVQQRAAQESEVQVVGFITTDRAALLELKEGFIRRVNDRTYAERELNSPAMLDAQLAMGGAGSPPPESKG